MSKLSLTCRKNIQEAEPKRAAALKKLKATTNIDFEIEVDFLAIAPVCEERGYKDRVGEVIYDWYMTALAENVDAFCKDPIQKESFVETFGERKTIAFVLTTPDEEDEAHRYAYVWTVNKGGVLEINIPPARLASNVSESGRDLSKTCSGDSPLSVATRKNIQDAQKNLTANIKALKKHTGIDFDTEFEWVSLAAASKERGYEDRVGEVIYDWYLKAFAENVETFCKDPIQKESFIETFGERHLITLVLAAPFDEDSEDPRRYSYCWTVNNGGVCEIHVPSARLASNVSEAGRDLAKTCSGDSPLSVATRKNIADSQKNLTANIKALKKHTGIDFDTEFEWVSLAAASKERGYEDRVGEVIYDWYLKAFAENVETFCKDPIQKESFIETFGERHLITLVLAAPFDEDSEDPHRYSYCWTVNNGGVCEIHVPSARLASNVSECGRDLAKTCSGDSPLSVATRKNISDSEAIRKKNLAAIKKALDFDFEIEIDWVPFAAASKDRGYEDRVGEVIHDWYLTALAGNITELCKDAMSKEALQEACEKKSIAFELSSTDEVSGYVETTFVDGVMKIRIPKERLASNVSETGKDIESRL